MSTIKPNHSQASALASKIPEKPRQEMAAKIPPAADQVALGAEAKAKEVSDPMPDLEASFGDKPQADPGQEAAKVALQTRVIAGQGSNALKALPDAPGLAKSANIPKIGAVGGLLGGGAQLAMGLSSASMGDLGGLGQAAAGASHVGHGAFQASDVLGGTSFTKPLEAGGAASKFGTLARGLGKAAPALGGAFQVYDGLKKGDELSTASGLTKLAGAALITTGIGAPLGAALVAGSTVFDVARWGYDKLT